MPSFRLDGRVALVTGGSRGLGLGVALALAESRRRHRARRARRRRARTRRRGWSARAAAARRRFRSTSAAREAPDDARRADAEELGGLDILVNGAGINLRKPAASFTREDFEGLMRINLEAAFFISQAAGQVMRATGWGRIICIGSIAAEVAIPNVGALRDVEGRHCARW